MAEPSYDIAIIGSGIASSLTLCRLASRLQSMSSLSRTLRIAIIEKADEQWTGVPYGRRSSKGALTFQRLSEFLNQPERSNFIDWLKANLDSWLAEFAECGGPSAERWIQDNQSTIDRDQWDELYLPRFLFGRYVSQHAARAVAQLVETGIASVTSIHGEATDVSRYPAESYLIQVKGSLCQKLRAQRVVLAIGSPPQRSIHPELLVDESSHTHVTDLYSPAEDANIKRIQHALSSIKDPRTANVLIVGSNASALEVLYLLNYRTEVRNLINSIVILSRGGKLPYRITGEFVHFELTALEELRAAAGFSAADLIKAITLDLQRASDMLLNLADLRDSVGNAVNQLLMTMHLSEQSAFVCDHGLSYSRMMRRAGRDTCTAADEFIELGLLTTIKGELRELVPVGDSLMALTYSSPEADTRITHPTLFSITINCGGFEELSLCTSPLIRSLIKNEICLPNSTDRGFLLNDSLEASENFFVIGPLVGGNFNDKVRFWHVESASRISSLADLLSEALCDSLLSGNGSPPRQCSEAVVYDSTLVASRDATLA